MTVIHTRDLNICQKEVDAYNVGFSYLAGRAKARHWRVFLRNQEP